MWFLLLSTSTSSLLPTGGLDSLCIPSVQLTKAAQKPVLLFLPDKGATPGH